METLRDGCGIIGRSTNRRATWGIIKSNAVKKRQVQMSNNDRPVAGSSHILRVSKIWPLNKSAGGGRCKGAFLLLRPTAEAAASPLVIVRECQARLKDGKLCPGGGSPRLGNNVSS